MNLDVPSGAFALELQHREKMLIAKINAYFGYPAVAQIRITQNAEIGLDAPEDEAVQEGQKILVTEAEENYIRKLGEGIENLELQQKLLSLGRYIINDSKINDSKK